MHVLRWLITAAPALLAAGCNDNGSNFSQFPGFAEWYEANPPALSLPTPDETILLEHHRPRIFLPEGHEGPIDFYRDYIAHGVLVDGEGEILSSSVDQALLNAEGADPKVVFTHQPSGNPITAKVYGRIASEAVDWPGCNAPITLTFLTYHLVFRSSGLPAGVPGWQAAGLSLIGDLEDWHQLDHYTAVTLTLAPTGKDGQRPIAATFQQHNYQRTYLLDQTAGPGRLTMPADGRLSVDVAIRSNELYPHETGRVSRRAVSFLDTESAAYMVADGPAPWLAGDDVTDPAVEIEPDLVFLRPADAFYTFKGWLGERRRLPGRDGPPGADYNTLPPMKPLLHQMTLSWWHEGDREWLAHFEALFEDGWPTAIDPAPFLARVADATDVAC